MPTRTRRPSFQGGVHYGWIVLAVSTLTVLGCLGFARFGYTMILPSMQAALGLTNTQTGVLATGNFVGYLAMGTLGGFVASRYGPRRVIALCMLLTGMTMLLTGLVGGFWGALAWRVLTGVGSGGSNVPVMALLSAWFAARRRGLASGIAVGGSSLGLILIGPFVPRILDGFGEDGWRYSWYILGAGVLLLGILGFVLLRERPEDRGLLAIGTNPDSSAAPRPLPGAGKEKASRPAGALDWAQVYRSGSLWHLALVYVAFGFSYVIYATFFAKYLQAEAGYSKEAAGNLWAIVGWISVFCGLIWGTVSDVIGRQYGLALVYLLQGASFAVFALWRSPSGYVLSTVLFGLTAWSIPGIVAAACGDCVGARLAPAAFGFVTLFFGLGQATGPSVAGALADRMGSFGPAFLLAAGVALVGGVASLMLRPQCEIAVA
jgi:sugar phosphate permease